MDTLDTLIAKQAIRELALLYSRGVDRGDIALLRTLYTRDGWDAHGAHFNGPAGEFVDFLEKSLPHMRAGTHLVCNHLIAVDGDRAEGEVYAIAWHLIPDGSNRQGGGEQHMIEPVRYCDQYAIEDGQWRFARRDVAFDMKMRLPADDHGPKPDPTADLSYQALTMALFGRGFTR